MQVIFKYFTDCPFHWREMFEGFYS